MKTTATVIKYDQHGQRKETGKVYVIERLHTRRYNIVYLYHSLEVQETPSSTMIKLNDI